MLTSHLVYMPAVIDTTARYVLILSYENLGSGDHLLYHQYFGNESIYLIKAYCRCTEDQVDSRGSPHPAVVSAVPDSLPTFGGSLVYESSIEVGDLNIGILG